MTRRQPPGPAPRLVLATLIGIVAVGGSPRALTDEEVFREFTFSFVSPGPRALGMGGAFSAVADDVTAVLANPAGLHYVTGTDAFVEFRSIDRDTRVTRSDLGRLPPIDRRSLCRRSGVHGRAAASAFVRTR